MRLPSSSSSSSSRAGFESSSETRVRDVGVEVASVFHLYLLDVGLDDAPKFLLEGARVRDVAFETALGDEMVRGGGDAGVSLVPSSREIIRHGPVGFAGVSRAVLEVKALLKAVDGLEFGLEGNVVTAGVLVERGLPTWTGGRRGEARGVGHRRWGRETGDNSGARAGWGARRNEESGDHRGVVNRSGSREYLPEE